MKRKIKVINITNKYGMFHNEHGIVPDWVEDVSYDFFKFLEKRWTNSLKIINN